MVTEHDKAIVAAIMAIVQIANAFFGMHWGLDQSTVTGIVTALGPLFVWLTPNKVVGR